MKKWYKSETRAEEDAKKENCQVVCGSNGWTDIYYLVPNDAEKGKIYRIISRSQGDCDGRNYMNRVIYVHIDGKISVIDKASQYRIGRVLAGDIPDNKVYDYLNGYYTLLEERSEKIRQRKENARMSHFLCDVSGAEGHKIRQNIRRRLSERGIYE